MHAISVSPLGPPACVYAIKQQIVKRGVEISFANVNIFMLILNRIFCHRHKGINMYRIPYNKNKYAIVWHLLRLS